MFAYGILWRNVKDGQWYFSGPTGMSDGSLNFVEFINRIGRSGWEAVVAGDFWQSGQSGQAEILFKKDIRGDG